MRDEDFISLYESQPNAVQKVSLLSSLARRRKTPTGLVSFFVNQIADETDPEVVEWIIICLRQIPSVDKSAASSTLWDLFLNRDQRESTRSYAIVALEKLGECIPDDQLKKQIDTCLEDNKLFLMKAIIRSIGSLGCTKENFKFLYNLRETHKSTIDAKIIAAIDASLLRVAKRALINKNITSSDLETFGAFDILERTRISRIRQAIEDNRARLLQKTMFEEEPETLCLLGEDIERVPGRALLDVSEKQYVQDVSTWSNSRMVERREPIRDMALTSARKKEQAYKCQICGAQGKMGKSSFVHAHHLEPLAEGGVDIGENILILCPNCHARIHTKEISVYLKKDTSTAASVLIKFSATDNVYEFSPNDHLKQSIIQRNIRFNEILNYFESLDQYDQSHLLAELSNLHQVANK